MITSFVITFREGLEAALIVSIILAYLGKISRRDLNKYLYLGAGSAILTSLFLGWAVLTLYGGLPKGTDKVFEGAASVTAAVVLTYMIVWMAKNSRKMKGEIQERLEIAVTTGYVLGIATLAFVSVFREGLETVLFLTALAVSDPLGTILGTLMGVGTVLVLSLLMLKGVYSLNIQKFFKYTSMILVVFAAGLMGYGVHEFIETGMLPPIVEHVWDINPQDSSHPLHEKGAIGSILKALVGYDGNPELLRMIVYAGYWLLIGLYLMRTYAPNYLRLQRTDVKSTDDGREERETTALERL